MRGRLRGEPFHGLPVTVFQTVQEEPPLSPIPLFKFLVRVVQKGPACGVHHFFRKAATRIQFHCSAGDMDDLVLARCSICEGEVKGFRFCFVFLQSLIMDHVSCSKPSLPCQRCNLRHSAGTCSPHFHHFPDGQGGAERRNQLPSLLESQLISSKKEMAKLRAYGSMVITMVLLKLSDARTIGGSKPMHIHSVSCEPCYQNQIERSFIFWGVLHGRR